MFKNLLTQGVVLGFRKIFNPPIRKKPFGSPKNAQTYLLKRSYYTSLKKIQNPIKRGSFVSEDAQLLI